MKDKYNKLSIALAIALIFAIAGLAFADSNGIWHRAEDIRGGVFGGDEQPDTTDYTFINPVEFNNTVVVNNELKADIIKSNSANGNVIIQLG